MLLQTTLNKIGRIFLTLAFLTVPLLADATHPAKMRWSAYKSTLLNLQVSVPTDWKPVKISKALAFRYDDLAGGNAAMGILKSDQNSTIEQAADQEFEHAGSPADWTRTSARIDGMRAIKIVGVDPKDPDRKMVHYYIETPQGNYIVQCQATTDRWSNFSPIFATILSKLKFL